jgi:hypothetical protein
VNLRQLWRRIVVSRYQSELESEVRRLRAENRALLNSILGIAGVPPVTVNGNDLAPEVTPVSGVRQNSGKAQPPSATQKMAVVSPMRRRSWHQVHRMLEIDSARKKQTV